MNIFYAILKMPNTLKITTSFGESANKDLKIFIQNMKVSENNLAMITFL